MEPRGAFPAVYLAQPLATCLAELARQAAATNISVAGRISQAVDLHTLEVKDLQVFDLREEVALQQVGLDAADIADDDWTACQSIGHAAHFLGYEGVLAPSAVGSGLVATAFESRLGPGQLTVTDTQILTEELYAASVG